MKVHDLKELAVDRNGIRFKLQGHSIHISLEKTGSRRLVQASEIQLTQFESDEYGIGLHWPLLDEDLSIAGLLQDCGYEALARSPEALELAETS